jgi:hypothetical protein
MKVRELIPVVLEEVRQMDDCWNNDPTKTLKKR